MTNRINWRRWMTAALVACAATGAQAQSIPAGKQMRIVVPYAAGGTSDLFGRVIAQQLGERLKRTVIVDNRAGSGGAIGTELVARGDADGTSILLHSGAIAVYPAFKPDLSFDVQKDLVAVTTASIGPFAVLVNNDLPVKTVAELIAYGKANPGKLNYGTPGIGTSVQLTTEYFKSMAGINMVHVPYKGAAPALVGAIGNEVQLVIDPLATARTYAEAGKLRALAITTGKRTPLWPGMPTVAETGLPGFDAGVWYGVFVSAKTPKAVVDQLNADIVAVLKSPEMTAWLAKNGMEAIADTPDAARSRYVEDIARWKKVIREAGIKGE